MRTRFRVRNTESTKILAKDVTWGYTPPLTFPARQLSPFFAKRETMADVAGSKFTVDGRPIYKPCTHLTLDLYGIQDPLPAQTYGLPGNYVSVTNLSGLTHVLQALHPLDPNYEQGDLLASCVEAVMEELNAIEPARTHYERWQVSKPSLATRASMSVFLYELRDLCRMFDFLPQKHLKLSSWRDVLRYANDMHLNFEFGWKPFIRDIQNLWKGLKSFDERLWKFVNFAGEVCSGTVRDEEVSGSTEILYEPPSALWHAKVEMSYKVTSSSSFQYGYELPDYDLSTLKKLGVLDTIGLNINPSTIWELIPWSFVVDWFANVGGALRTQDNLWAEPYINFAQACSTIAREAVCKWYVKYANAGGYTGNPYCHVFTVRIKSFKRTLGSPFGSVSDASELDSNRIRLLSSLVLGRVL